MKSQTWLSDWTDWYHKQHQEQKELKRPKMYAASQGALKNKHTDELKVKEWHEIQHAEEIWFGTLISVKDW